ncbi:MAG: hypothetical protein AAGI24_10785 [Pseudomonadota bacterium]
MSTKDYSEASFISFMRQSVVSGLVNPATLRSRKLAAEQLFTELKPHERQDLRLVDVEELAARFHKLEESSIRPESMAVYQSRLRDALADFIAWVDDPKDFTPRDSEQKQLRDMLRSEPEAHRQAREELALNPPRNPHEIFPVPIREDHVVYIQNVPLDMSQREADKIAAVVRALAMPEGVPEDPAENRSESDSKDGAETTSS